MNKEKKKEFDNLWNVNKKKITILELEEILVSEKKDSVKILTDGSIVSHNQQVGLKNKVWQFIEQYAIKLRIDENEIRIDGKQVWFNKADFEDRIKQLNKSLNELIKEQL